MKGLSSTTPPARGLQARAAACTPKKGEGTGRAIKRQRCRLKPLRPELRSPVFAGLVADRKSSASTDMTRPVGSLPNRCVLVPQARPRQTRTSARRLLALGGFAEIVLHPPLHRAEKQKARYRIDSALSFAVLVPERGIEPPTFSLRMSCSTD